MAELNLKQIIDRLNEEFTGDTRKLVFWYDDKADFADCGLKEADIVGGFMITWILERTYFGKMRRNL